MTLNEYDGGLPEKSLVGTFARVLTLLGSFPIPSRARYKTISSIRSSMPEDSKPPPTLREILDKSAKSAVRGGTAGAVAMGVNVGALMWMRTTVSPWDK